MDGNIHGNHRFISNLSTSIYIFIKIDLRVVSTHLEIVSQMSDIHICSDIIV